MMFAKKTDWSKSKNKNADIFLFVVLSYDVNVQKVRKDFY